MIILLHVHPPYIFGTGCLAELGGGLAVPPASSFFFTFLGCELLTERVGGGGGGAEAPAAAALLEEAELLLPLLPPLPDNEKKRRSIIVKNNTIVSRVSIHRHLNITCNINSGPHGHLHVSKVTLTRSCCIH